MYTQATLKQKESKHVKLENVLYIPDLQINLLSVSKAIDNGYKVICIWKGALLTKEGKIELRAHSRGEQIVNSVLVKNKQDYPFKDRRRFVQRIYWKLYIVMYVGLSELRHSLE